NNDYREIALTKMGTRQLTLTLLSIFAVTMVSIGTTFAMFTVSSKSAEYNVVKTGTLTIDFSSSSSTIGLNNALPMSDSSGLAQTGNTFTIRNTGTLPANYTVSLRDDKDMITQDNCSDKQLDKSYIKYSIDNTTAKLLNTSTESLITGTLNAGESKTFTLKLWINNSSPNTVLNKHYHGKIVVDAAQETNTVRGTASEMIASANPETLDYNTANVIQKNQMWAFTHEATEQLAATTDYRYIGANPNNYVKFNDELWRIIGVFDVDDGTGKIEKRMKIIRNESIGNYTWSNQDTSTERDPNLGKNNWSDARLNYLLNSGHESETYGGSLYWNRKSGNCYYMSRTTSCDFTSTGLTDSAKSMIGDAKWYLGGSSTNNDVTPPMFYTRERGTTVYNSSRSTNWIGKVGLMYPSDYGYATSGGSSTNRASCMSKELYNWEDSSYSDCKNNDWLNINYPQWTMSPRADTYFPVFTVNFSGNVYGFDAGNVNASRPVVHLKSTIKVISGSGTTTSPFILSV
ncbi:hypothetical protein EGP98_01255, partial [bacterium]|nr:hypothetical protein [bacterium]